MAVIAGAGVVGDDIGLRHRIGAIDLNPLVGHGVGHTHGGTGRLQYPAAELLGGAGKIGAQIDSRPGVPERALQRFIGPVHGAGRRCDQVIDLVLGKRHFDL